MQGRLPRIAQPAAAVKVSGEGRGREWGVAGGWKAGGVEG